MHVVEGMDAAFISEVGVLLREMVASIGIDMAFQRVDDEFASLPGARYSPRCGGALFVLRHRSSGRLAGCMAVKDLGGGVAEAKRLLVRPEWRGRDLGRLLLAHVVDVAAMAGYERIRLDTLERLRPANRIYNYLGFRRIQPYNVNPEPDVLYFELDGLQGNEYLKGREDAFHPFPRIKARSPAIAARS